jgi:hypothetical protein
MVNMFSIIIIRCYPSYRGYINSNLGIPSRNSLLSEIHQLPPLIYLREHQHPVKKGEHFWRYFRKVNPPY